ncbi:MAG: alpha/beta hydrolase [Collinsella sp.]|nr:alpha/beta hydrolase [Collinsella sp.]
MCDMLTIHTPLPSRDRHVAVFYLHGGGLLYGERDDLPAPYVQMMLEAGYTLVCADYPLAPEAPLPEIVDAVFDLWRSSVGSRLLSGEFAGHFLFGRSSGAHLALLLAREIARRETDQRLQPLGVLDFYGYHDLADAAFHDPARAYLSLPEVPRTQIARFLHAPSPIVTSGPKPLRFNLYVHARQHAGAWIELLGLDGSEPRRDVEAWSLSDDDIAALPPLFICASTDDEDVPYRISKTLARAARAAVMKTVYYLPHDFDRDLTKPDGRTVYGQALDWMARRLG